MVHAAWSLILHRALWIPLLFTSISSCLCNAAVIQQCIVMPGCPSAPIPFKAHPTGWHQGVGCCSSVWHLLKQLGKFSSLHLILAGFYLCKPRQFCLTGGFSLFGFSTCVQHLSADFFFHPPTPFSPLPLKKHYSGMVLITKHKHRGRDSFFFCIHGAFLQIAAGERV